MPLDYILSIPLEIWEDIFRWATLVPYSLDSSSDTLSKDARYRGILSWPEVDDSMPTKTSLVLVCKAWRRLCLPYLFKVVQIRPRRIPMASYIDALDPEDKSARSPCQYIQRLNVITDDSGAVTDDFVVRIIKRCTNLQVYAHYATGRTQVRAMVPINLILKCGKTIRQIELMGHIQLPIFFGRFLGKDTPNLESFVTNREVPGTSDAVTLDRLHTLGLGCDLQPPEFEWRLPSLKRFVQYSNLNPRHFFQLPTPLRPNLRILDIGCLNTPDIQYFLEIYPELETIVLPARLKGLGIVRGQYPLLRRVEIYVGQQYDIVDRSEGEGGTATREELTEGLSKLLSRVVFPSLEIVRILVADIGFFESQSPFWNTWKDKMAGCNIDLILEDERGTVISFSQN